MGDSPILIKDKDGKINISPDHNIRTNDAERRAAEDRGGFCDGGYLFASFDGMGLQMARALGDSHLNKVLSRLPDVYAVEINENSFVLVGTDGLFDPGHWNFKVEADAVVKLIDEGADAAALVTRAVNIPTGDNVTAILARFANE
jgi:serine/threonine protein phosphatase PrpC